MVYLWFAILGELQAYIGVYNVAVDLRWNQLHPGKGSVLVFQCCLFVCLFVFKCVIPTMDDCPIEPSLYLTDSSSSFHELVEHIHVKEYSFSALPRSSICVSSLFKLLTSKFRSYGCCTIISFNSYAIHFKVLLPSKSKDQFRLKWACMRPKE